MITFVIQTNKYNMKTEVIQIRVEQKLKDKLQQMSDADNRKLADYIRLQLIKLAEQSKKK